MENENGNVIYYFVGEYEYNEDGVMLSKKTYKNGSLSTEEYFKTTEDGWTYTESETVYYPELGNAFISIYNEFGDQIGRIIYDADDNIVSEFVFEIEYDENGNAEFSKSGLKWFDEEQKLFDSNLELVKKALLKARFFSLSIK